MDANDKRKWRVALYVWGWNSLILLGIHDNEWDRQPTADDIRNRLNLKRTPAALVREYHAALACPPPCIDEKRDDLVPVCEPVLSIMARLSK